MQRAGLAGAGGGLGRHRGCRLPGPQHLEQCEPEEAIRVQHDVGARRARRPWIWRTTARGGQRPRRWRSRESTGQWRKRELAVTRAPSFAAVLPAAGRARARARRRRWRNCAPCRWSRPATALLEIVVEEIARVLRLARQGGRPASAAGRDRHGFADDAGAAQHRGGHAAGRPADDVARQRHYACRRGAPDRAAGRGRQDGRRA